MNDFLVSLDEFRHRQLMSKLEIMAEQLERAAELSEQRVQLIQRQAGTIESLERDLALAQVRIEELEAELDSATEQTEER